MVDYKIVSIRKYVFVMMLVITVLVSKQTPAKSTAFSENHESAQVITYPAPKDISLSDQYSVKVNGQPVDLYLAPVWNPNVFWVKPFGGPYSFGYFDFSGTVTVTVTTKKPLNHVRLRPESHNIAYQVKKDTMSFTLDKPCQVSIEPDKKNGPLLLFANPIENNPPQKNDANVIYFGPGVHKAGEINVSDNQTVYIAGGAVVKGGIHAKGENIRILGRGIIDGLDWERFKGPTNHPVFLNQCKNTSVDGIILKDAWGWTFVLAACRDITINNVKLCSTRCENNDGIGTLNSINVSIKNSFLRTDDDCITAKGFGYPNCDPNSEGMPVENLLVENCILWTDRAHNWRLGCENWAPIMKNLVFRNIDVLHSGGPWVATIQPAEDMMMKDVLFENIRIDVDDKPGLIEIFPAPTKWFRRRNTPGNVRNVTFKDITITGTGQKGLIKVIGCSPLHTVEDVTFDNVMYFGDRLTENTRNVHVLEHTKNIVFK